MTKLAWILSCLLLCAAVALTGCGKTKGDLEASEAPPGAKVMDAGAGAPGGGQAQSGENLPTVPKAGG